VLLAAGPRLEDVHAFDLRTGQALWPGEAPAPTGEAENLPEPSARLLDRCHQFGVPRFTMTATGNMLLVKLGPQATSVPFEERRGPIALGQVAALDLTAQKKLLFEISLKHEPWGPGWAVEGPPVADGQHLYVAVRRRDNLRAQAHVACFGRKHGELRWRRSIVAGETPGQGQWLEYTHNLLTLDQGMLYYNTNLGATAALRADDGEMVWLVRYPRAPFDDENPDHSRRHWYRDLNPCVVAKELVLVAPADCDRIFALDATTGMLLWTTEPQHAVDAVHVLGVSGNHLIASGDRIYWIDVRTGRITTSFPMRVEASLRGYGRGLLTGDAVYWPTRERIFVFAQDGSRQTRQPIELGPLGVTGGNLVISDETLLIAGATQLVAFNPYGRQVPQATGGR
jgi:outer membrane protein assembly factor BamB